MKSAIGWVDIPALDLDRAIKFYTAVYGEVSKQEGPGFSIGLFPHDDNSVGGCIYLSTDNPPSKSGPLIYIDASGRLDDAIAAVVPNGGEVVAEKHQIGPHGYRAIVIDSEGNRIALHSPTP